MDTAQGWVACIFLGMLCIGSMNFFYNQTEQHEASVRGEMAKLGFTSLQISCTFNPYSDACLIMAAKTQ